jgi:uncharacterized membrane-anchored protein
MSGGDEMLKRAEAVSKVLDASAHHELAHSGQVRTTWALWLFMTVLVLLVFQCRGVSLWPTATTPCVEVRP